MSSTIDTEDKIWNIFLGYTNLISNEAPRLGMDIYGTEQKTNMASSLTLAHIVDHVAYQIKDLQNQHAASQRSRQQSRDFQVI